MPKTNVGKPKKKVKSRPSEQQWIKACSWYGSGDWTQKQIAEELGVSPEAVYRQLKKRGIEKGSMIEELTSKALQTQREKAQEELEELMDKAFESKKMTVRASIALQNLTMRRMKEAADAGKPIAAIMPDLKAINQAINNIGQGWNNISVSLGLHKEDPHGDEMEELLIYEMSQDDIEEERRRQEENLMMMKGESPGMDQLEDIDLDDIEIETGED